MRKMTTISTAATASCLLLLLLLLLLCDVIKTTSARPSVPGKDRWQSFKLRCHKTYKSVNEEDTRHTIWEMNIEDISRHNSEHAQGKHDYRLGENCLTDLTNEEFRSKFGLRSQANHESDGTRKRRFAPMLPPLPDMPVYQDTVPADQLPDSVNWVEKPGWVRPVVDQGFCGSCWAQAATGVLEAQYFNNTNNSITLSRQNLIDCSRSQGNLGCRGGFTHAALWYVQQHGIQSLDAYPDISDQTGWTGACNFRHSSSVMSIDKWMLIDENNELALQQAIAFVGPVAVGIDADYLPHYSDGVYSSTWCSRDQLNHMVLAVGYGVHNNQSYWLLKNSWGSSWGMDGYMMLARNKNNMCGVSAAGVFPLMKLDNFTRKNPHHSLDSTTVSTLQTSSPVHSTHPSTTTTTTTTLAPSTISHHRIRHNKSHKHNRKSKNES